MIMPYLNFTGKCEEAFKHYQRAFNGQEPLLARYSDAPDSAYPFITGEDRNKIMHAHVMLTETGGISGCDNFLPFEKGAAVNLHVYCATPKQAQEAFDVLAEEGETISKIIPNSPPHDNGVSGAVKDKYGFTWVLSAQS
ncbi:MAG: VOC family protein [Oscillospiraceae bacterium]